MGIASSLFYVAGDNCLDWRIRPSDEQFDAQKERWNDLADHLRDDLRKRSNCAIASWLQGSYKFGTQVRPATKGQEFDIDLGVYFQWEGKPSDGPHSPASLKEFVQESLTGYAEDDGNDAEAVGEPRPRCSRMHFKDDFHIDIPAYHLDPSKDARSLAAESKWEDSDPKAIYKWWKDTIEDSERPRARRIVRYLKMWAALNFDDDDRPSSILLTVLAAQAYIAIDLASLSGDDEVLKAVVTRIEMRFSTVVRNPANTTENLNRLSDNANKELLQKLRELISTADRALSAPSKIASADVWSEVFSHFFPVPDEGEQLAIKDNSQALASINFEPIVLVRAEHKGRVYQDTNKIGPIPKGLEIKFTLANAQMLPVGASVHWTVRNAGKEAETENDLGHRVGTGLSVTRDSAYRGDHFMDVSVRRNGGLIGSKRIPVKITALGFPLRNPPRPAWTRLRK
jgi:hypothetical protein